ncbi:DUF2339 domain-containing protein [Sedimenticola thiotaurini]|uniref:DUF2339 domain-containing protein n=1 Tax=Sedimenticola thiotaurini TaxID=1543721 RepID=A0A0F7K2E7_9GAMM|nr:DUF2339 domain-containing protein [Sedimenticola thiotaurini]AKH21078.1 hypothetical protein AAY24_12750 [Sedimenticola thiotaurini]
MAYTLALLGGVISAGLLGTSAAIFGALIGFLLGTAYRQGRRLEQLDRELEQLRSRLAHPAEATAGEAGEVPPATSAAALSAEPEELDFDLELVEETPPPRSPSRPSVRPTPEPHAANLFDRAVAWIRDYFTGGNLIVRVGVIVLFFGVAFLLKYAAEHSQISIEFRLMGVAVAGMVLLILGWRLRSRRALYGLALQGGAVGLLYLTVFSALRLYSLLPATLAFGMLLLFVTLTALLALLQNASSLAILATAGGFLAPVLTSTGEGSHVALFSYYLLLNGGVLAIAWFKSWRLLNLVGFGFTFVIGALWGYHYYQPEFFTSTEPFLIAFFLMYAAIAVLFAWRQPPNLKGVVDGTLVFGVPLASAGLQAALVRDMPYGLAFSAVALGGFYILLASLLFKRGGHPLRMLSESFLGTGVVFATLAILFALEGRLSSAFWALEGAAMIWIGIRQSRRLPRLFGLLLQLLAGLLYLDDSRWMGDALPLVNSQFLGAGLIALGGLFTAFYLDRHADKRADYEKWVPPLFFFWGVLWWLGAAIQELDRYANGYIEWVWLLVMLALTAGLAEWLRLRLPWGRLRLVTLGLLPALGLVVLGVWLDLSHPLKGMLLPAWLLAFVVQYGLLYRQDSDTTSIRPLWHGGSFWLLTFLLTVEAAWQLDQAIAGSHLWEMIPWGAVPMLLALGLLTLGQRLRWPVQRHLLAYNIQVLAPVLVYLLGWAMLANVVSPGNPWPIDYLPVLNPLDLTILAILLLLLKWWQRTDDWLEQHGVRPGYYFAGLGVALFLWLNGMVVRAVHHWGGVPFDADLLIQSQVLQAALAVLWASIGLGSMLAGTRTGRRSLWLSGAGLMGLVVLKLFLVDLSNTGTVARIVAFIGVGVLLLIVGYFSPAPPRQSGKVALNQEEG